MIRIYLVFVLIPLEDGGFAQNRWQVYTSDAETAIDKVKEKYDPLYVKDYSFKAVSSPLPENPMMIGSEAWDAYGIRKIQLTNR